MNKVIKILVALILVATNYYLITPSLVNAQQTTLSLSPPLLETIIKPGKSIVVGYRLENLADPVIVKAMVRPFRPQDNTNAITIQPTLTGPIAFTLDNADLQLEEAFFLRTKENRQLLLRLTVPTDTPESDYYYTLIVQTQPPPQTEGSTTSRSQMTIGSNILVTVTATGSVDIKGKIALFTVVPRYRISLLGKNWNIVDSQDRIPLIAVVQNIGKNVIKPQGEIILRGNFGEKASYDVTPKNVLAQSQRILSATPTLTVDCQNQPTDPLCQTASSLVLAGFFVGQYNLSTTLNFGESTPNLYAATTFIAVPFRLLLAVGVVILISLVIIRRSKKEKQTP
ncbi:hypothetical protein M1523_01390 [Patescibacteria group bacterium]|nr:hypothetical protein [Patescibacteria group bacterium]MCL5091566.1 hypothetical protein [Patescibacteria group bacterium]